MSDEMEHDESDWSGDNPDYGNLPMEIILHIFDYLNPADKKAVSTTCRRWYEAFIDLKFQTDFVLKFSGDYLADNIQPVSTILNCFDRPFVGIYLEKVELGSTNAFFEHIGLNVEELTIDSMDINELQLTSMLKELRRLKRLTIKQCPEIFMSGQFLKPDNDKKLLAHTFENLQSLAIMDNRYLTDAILSRIVEVTPHLQRLDLSGSPITFHNAVCRRFYPNKNMNDRSEAVLTFRFVQDVIEKYCETLSELDLSHTLIGAEALEILSTIGPVWRLKKLRLKSCLQLTLNSFISFLTSQPDITFLDCSSSNLLTANWASRIVELLPHLQVLKLSNCKTLNDCDVKKIAESSSLKHLDISYCSNLTAASILQGIGKERNERLEELILSGLNINETCLIQCTNNFPNLRLFDVGNCVTAVTDAVVQAINENLVWLRELNLENCSLITDTGITGIDCSSSFKSDPPATPTPRVIVNTTRSMGSLKISLRSRAEEEIVADAERKRALLAIIEDENLIEDGNAGHSIKRLKGLRSLNLGGCTKITDISLKYGLVFRELSTLSLSNCQQISFAGIQVLVRNCSSIENLHLLNCCNINDITIELIAMKLKRLRFIDIRGCRLLTENYINDIHFHCKTLKV